MSPMGEFEEYATSDVVIAAIELIGRTGAKDMTFGYLHDDVPIADAGWWAHAQFRGARIMVENQAGPDQAIEALAKKLLTGGKCTHCGGLIALSPFGARFFPGARMADGSEFSEEQARNTPQCLWRRVGQHWVMGCQR